MHTFYESNQLTAIKGPGYKEEGELVGIVAYHEIYKYEGDIQNSLVSKEVYDQVYPCFLLDTTADVGEES